MLAPKTIQASFADILKDRGNNLKDKIAYTYLVDGEDTEERITYKELLHESQLIASYLLQHFERGEKAILFYPYGLDFIKAFYGCLLAGIIAIPSYLPKLNSSLERVELIIRNSGAKLVLSNFKLANKPFIEKLVKSTGCKMICTDSLSHVKPLELPKINPDDIAFIQYTSGSVSNPKGVIVKHRNIVHNESLIKRSFNLNQHSIVVGWLPFYHDMGLIGNIIQPIYSGFTAILMSPMHFLQKPIRWIKAISKYKATVSGGPDFAYDLCVKNIKDDQLEDITLDSWLTAFNGAERVNLSTIESFSTKFKKAGFNKNAFTPCYGMAEATLLVSVKKFGTAIVTVKKSINQLQLIDGEKLQEVNNIIDVVSCGTIQETDLLVVDGNNHIQPESKVGEILILGESIFCGYWMNHNENERAFIHINGKKYFKTGDLGFVYDQELYITGRLKEILIINGRNYYPYDIENQLKLSISAFNTNVAVFTNDLYNDNNLIVVAECAYNTGHNYTYIFEKVKKIIFQEFGLNVGAISLIRQGTMPKTTSGKIQRLRCRRKFLNKELHAFSQWPDLEVIQGKNLTAPTNTKLNDKEVEVFKAVKEYIGNGDIDINIHPLSIGFDSIKIIQLAGRLSEKFKVDIQIELFFKHPTLYEICKEIATLKKQIELFEPESNEDQIVDLSSTQKAIWFDTQLKKDETGYNLSALIEYKESVNAILLEKVIREIIYENEILRTNFDLIDGKPKQIIKKESSFHLVVKKNKDNNPLSNEEVNSYLTEKTSTVFNLQKDNLLKAFLVKNGEEHYKFYLLTHHIICDGSALLILISEIKSRYESYIIGNKHNSSISNIQYKEFVRWENNYLRQIGDSAKTYWNSILKDEPEKLNLPYDKNPQNVNQSKGRAYNTKLSYELKNKIELFSRDNKVTSNITLLASYILFLHKITKQTDILIALPVANRVKQKFRNSPGVFINVVLLRVKISITDGFNNILVKVKEGLVNALKYQSYPFSEVLSIINKRKSGQVYSHTPVFFNNLNFLAGDLCYNVFDVFSGNENLDTNIDLNLYVFQDTKNVHLRIVYNEGLFKSGTINNLLTEYKKLVSVAVTNKNKSVVDFMINPLKELTVSEKQKIISLGNGNSDDRYKISDNIIKLFEANVEKEKIAYKWSDENITYDTLDKKSDILARVLNQRGVKKGNLVPLVVNKCIDLPMSILAIWKAGGAYIPIDTSWPANRINMLIGEINMPVVVADKNYVQLVDDKYDKILLSEIDYTTNVAKLNIDLSSEDYIYGIYTSGTTGIPKCALNYHKGILNRLLYMNKKYGYNSNDVVLFTSKQIFDASVWQMFWPLINSGKCIIPRSVDGVDILEYIELIEKEQVTIMDFVPSVFHIFVDYLEDNKIDPKKIQSLRQLLIGGEAMNSKVVRRFRELLPHVGITNTYGPTEASIGTIFYEVGEEVPDIIPIGKPIDNVKAIILDDDMNLVPYGEKGNLFLGGACLGAGYYNQPDKTKEVFLKNPIVEIETKLIYKTGDLACYLDNGDIQFIGRNDNQVKINGIRIELKEIESCINLYPGIKETVVLNNQSKRITNLCAYYTCDENVDDSGLREYLRENLPMYMVPPFLFRLQKFPITNIGKVDLKALPEPDIQNQSNHTSAQTETEIVVAKIWAKLFNTDIKSIDINTSFFDYGGHSLNILKLLSEIKKELGVRLTIEEIYAHLTVQQISRLVLNSRLEERSETIFPVKQCERFPLSSYQSKFFSNAANIKDLRFCITNALLFEGKFSLEKLKRTFDLLIGAHEALRTYFVLKEGKYYQSVVKKAQIEYDTEFCAEENLSERFISFNIPLDVFVAPLIRIKILRMSESRNVLLLSIHHTIIDAIGFELLMKHFMEAYRNGRINKPVVHLKDFSVWQNLPETKFKLIQHKKFWLNKLHQLNVTKIKPDLDIKKESKESSTEGISLYKEHNNQIDKLCQKLSITKYSYIHFIFSLVIYEVVHNNRITIATRVSIKDYFENLENTIGAFLNKIIIQADIDSSKSCKQNLVACNKTIIESLQHGIIPYEDYKEEVKQQAKINESELFDIVTNYVSKDQTVFYLDNDLTLKQIKVNKRGLTRHSLDLMIYDLKETIFLEMYYNGSKYTSTTIKNILKRMSVLSARILEKPDNQIENILFQS